jgi:hypothetical protein
MIDEAAGEASGEHPAFQLRVRWPFRWRPEPITAGLLLGGFFAYFAYLNLQAADYQLGEVFDRLPSPAGNLTTGQIFAFRVPTSVRELAALGLVFGLAEAIVAVGCLVVALGRRAGIVVAASGLVVAAAAQVGSLVATGSLEVGSISWRLRALYIVDAVGCLVLVPFMVAITPRLRSNGAPGADETECTSASTSAS